MTIKLLLISSLLQISLFAQSVEPTKPFTRFNFGVLAGINFASRTGSSLFLEGKTNLTNSLDAKISLGYSAIHKADGSKIKTYNFINIQNIQQYVTGSYTIDEIKYDVFPISLGFEYNLIHDSISPFGIFEIGYNDYSYHMENINSISGVAGYFNTFDEIPSDYKYKPAPYAEPTSYRIAMGIGLHYKISSAIKIDIRYLYQFNNLIEDNNVVLVGINL